MQAQVLPLPTRMRHDRLLLGGLTGALLVIFQRPIRSLLEMVHEFEEVYGLALLPGLIILLVILIFHHQSKRHDQRIGAAASAASAKYERERSVELAQFVSFGEALQQVGDIEGLREVVHMYLPQFVEDRQAWVLIRTGGKWETLAGGGQASRGAASGLEALADQALELETSGCRTSEGTEIDGHICFTLHVGDATVGVVGVDLGREAASIEWRQSTGVVAALLAIAVRNTQLVREIHERGGYDGLTGCFNRMHAMEVLDSELQRADRAKLSLAMIMFDLDHFKSINDRYGHLCGDAVLAAIGQRVKGALRNSDVKCRYGGEEFLVLLPDTSLAGAAHVAESLRREIGQTSVLWHSDSVSTTASFGVSVSTNGELGSRALISRADTALYEAKREGRNRVCVDRQTDATPPVPDVVIQNHRTAGRRRATFPHPVSD